MILMNMGITVNKLEDLQLELADYIDNHIRIHGSLEYMSPVLYKNVHYKNCLVLCRQSTCYKILLLLIN
ncbi:IS3 family transposase [Lysinibacillus sp. NPDC056185]|uniref:IS3 family transposase n=1 Tax=Lysinibacillus sp. NPDC056185 TaxID=3345739 RepID=UPI0039EEF169